MIRWTIELDVATARAATKAAAAASCTPEELIRSLIVEYFAPRTCGICGSTNVELDVKPIEVD